MSCKQGSRSTFSEGRDEREMAEQTTVQCCLGLPFTICGLLSQPDCSRCFQTALASGQSFTWSPAKDSHLYFVPQLSHRITGSTHTRVLALREKNPRGVQKCTKKSELLLPSSEQPFPSVINSNMQSTKMGPEYLFGSEFYC